MKADKVIVLKSKRELILTKGRRFLKTYRIALGGQPEGHKIQEGDQKTPEGNYILDWRNPDSNYYRSIHISYPNESDVLQAEKLSVPPGGDIMIHGLHNDLTWMGKFHSLKDWTRGCIAVTNQEIEEIWQAVEDGTPVEIRP